MKKILVTGSNGMLGRSLSGALKNRFSIFGLGRQDGDTTRYIRCDIRHAVKLARAVSRLSPDIIIHSAAISDVDYCQDNPGRARSVNAVGTKNISLAAKECGAGLIYLSTDYVFSGRKKVPYRETDRTHPINVYGLTKLEGEKFVRRILKDYLIIRTSWLFGPGRDNFVTRILKRAETEKEMKIVADKFGSPTYTADLACAIRELILSFCDNREPFTANRTVHISNSGCCSRYEFSKKIFECAAIKGIKLEAIKSSEFGWKAKRPDYSILDNSRFKAIMGYKLRPWQEALGEYIRFTKTRLKKPETSNQ